LSLMEQISRSEEGEQIARQRLEALYPPDLDNLSSSASSGAEARYVTSLLGGISISFGDDDDRREIVERFLWKVGRNEQRRMILDALEFLRALHAVSGKPPEVFASLKELLDRYELAPAPLVELEQLVSMLQQSGVPDTQILLNLALGRGVSYYTGLVFEIHAQDKDGFDAQLCGGGRYDRLMRAVGSSRDLQACGFAMGIERLLAFIPDDELPQVATTQAVVIAVSAKDMPYAFQVARSARASGMCVEVDVTTHGVGAGLRQAARRQIPLALIVGEDEQRQGVVTVRNLITGEEQVTMVETLVHGIGKEQRL
ncbi:MAG TPA: ATP phosphoribosyltransferase regulatory subunit, partial [Ktedonobacteraceae bacterium]